jgi:hypothetical protein
MSLSSMQVLVSVGMDNSPMQELAAAVPPHVFTRSSGGRGRNGGGAIPAAIEFLLLRRLWRHYFVELIGLPTS